jgi:hypothetical protein
MVASDRAAALRSALGAGLVIPAHPLALTARRTLDERRQRALTRYYLDAGAGGVAVGVHTTQFEIRRPEHGLVRPVLALAAETARAWPREATSPFVLVAGAIGETRQAVAEAEIAALASVSAAPSRSSPASTAGSSRAARARSNSRTAACVHTAHCPSRPPTMRRVRPSPTANGVTRSATMESSLPV